MTEMKSQKSSFTFYTEDDLVERVDESDEYTRSKAITEALEQWIPENIDN